MKYERVVTIVNDENTVRRSTDYLYLNSSIPIIIFFRFTAKSEVNALESEEDVSGVFIFK